MKCRHLSEYRVLDSPPKQVMDDVLSALRYAHLRIFRRFADSASAGPPADKAVQADEISELVEGEGEIESEMKVDVGMQTTGSPQGGETVKPQKGTRKRYQTIVAEFQEKQRRFEWISFEREAAHRLADAVAQQEAEVCRIRLQAQRSEELQARHLHYMRQRQLREQQKRQGDDSLRRLRLSLPLHERIAAVASMNAWKAELDARDQLSNRSALMRRISSDEIREHEETHDSAREALLRQLQRERESQLQRIRAENKSLAYYQSPLLELEAAQQKAELQRLQQRTEQARVAAMKRKVYAELAMEVHRPHPLRKSIQSPVPATSKTPTLPRAVFRNPRRRLRKRSDTRCSVQCESNRSIDYNSEMRGQEERLALETDRSSPLFNYVSSEDETPTDASVLMEKAGRLSREARLGEAFITRISRDPTLHAQACSSVSEMYLDSIKAKLKVVNAALNRPC